MTDGYSVILVMTKDVLMRFPEQKDKYISFLTYWLSVNETKAVVSLSAWKEFENYWNDGLKSVSPEIRNPFFATMRGSITPYRTKYATEAGMKVENEIETNSIDEKTIVNWHYATVRYLISDNPDEFRLQSSQIRIQTASILTPKEFYSKYEVENEEFIKSFLQEFEE